MTLNIAEIYDHILAVEFNQDTHELEGKIAMKPISSSSAVIHIVNFKGDQMAYLLGAMKVVKLDGLNEIPRTYSVKFTAGLKLCLITPDVDAVLEYYRQQIQTYVYDMETAFT